MWVGHDKGDCQPQTAAKPEASGYTEDSQDFLKHSNTCKYLLVLINAEMQM